MRSTASSIIILTLTMFLLLCTAVFLFLLQGRQQLVAQRASLGTAVAGLEVTREGLELAFQSAESARLATDAQLATAVAEKLSLEGQLVESDQQINELEATVTRLGNDLTAVEGTRTAVEATISQAANQPPTVNIVSPETGSTVLVNAPVIIIFSLADPAGVVSATLTIDGQPLKNYELDRLTLYTAQETWVPTQTGQAHISLIATNANGRVSEPVDVVLTITETEAQSSQTPAADLPTEIALTVAELRGIQAQTAVEMEWINSQQLQQYVADDLLLDYTAEQAEAERLVYAAFDLLPPEFDLHRFRHQLYNEQIAGFYDPEAGRFFILGDETVFDLPTQLIYVHEYVHVLQHQQFDLAQLQDNGRDADGRLALLALVEGEAVLVEQLYRQQLYLANETAVVNSPNKPSPVLESAPAVLSQTLLFPYQQGHRFAQLLYNQNGFAALDQAWQQPPQSSEQILHPERYLSGDTPQLVTLPPLTDTLGVGWSLLAEDVLGEWLLRLYLGQQLNQTQVDTAATGWGGDRYAVYRHANGQLAMVLALVWDTDMDATEFGALYPTYAEQLLGTAGQLQNGQGECWRGVAETICLFQNGRRTVISRAPTLQTAVQLANQASQLEPAATP